MTSLSIRSASWACVTTLGLLSTGFGQEIIPLPSLQPSIHAPRYDSNVHTAGAVAAVPDGPAMLPPSADAKPTMAASTGTTVAATESSAASGGNGLTQADVERIVAEYLAARSTEGQMTAAEAPMPMSKDALPSEEPEWYSVGSDKKLTAQWNNGLELQSANKDFKVHVGGRTQLDTSFFGGDQYLEQPVARGGIGQLNDSMQFRRARLRVDGTIYEQIEFAFEYEFLNDNSVDFLQTPPVANTTPAPTDAWVNFTKLPFVDSLRIGNQKDPLGFEHIESSRYLDFIERSFNQDLFYGPFNNGFSPGIVASKYMLDKRASLAAGVFGNNMNANTNIYGYGIGNDYMYVVRGTVLPYWEQDGRYMLHLGTTYEFRDSDDGRIRIRTRGNVRNGPPGPFNAVYADTTSLLADDQDLLNFECVLQWGSLLIQSEYCFSTIYGATQFIGVPAPVGRGNVAVNGGYVEMLYFLTGEHRAYSHERGAFDRVVPNQNAFRVMGRNRRVCQGPGAWQVGVRFDHADINDNGVNGGMLNGLTFGINWFLNPNMKLQFNYDWTHRGQVQRFVAGANNVVPEGDVYGLGTRLAIDF